MKSIWKVTRFLALAGVAALMFAPRAEATSIEVVPHFQNVTVTDTFTVDIEAVGFSPSLIGGASFELSFDPTILTGVGDSIDPTNALDGNSGNLLSGFAAGPGLYDAYFISTASPIPSQTDPFILDELTFKATGTGLSHLTLTVQPAVGVFLTNDAGVTIPTIAVNGCVLSSPEISVPPPSSDTNIAAIDPCGTAAAVPEPATFGLLATGLATVLARRRRKNQQ